MIFPSLKGKRGAHVELDEFSHQWMTEKYGLLPEENPLLIPEICQGMLGDLHQARRLDYSYGGYLEPRPRLWRGSYLEEGKKFLHQGMDFNAPVGTPVAVDRKVEVLHVDDDSPERHGWGNRIFFRVMGEDIALIYAHMARSIRRCTRGDILEPGDIFGEVGGFECNGGWYSHTHVQAMQLARFRAFLEHPEKLDGYGFCQDIASIAREFPNPMHWVLVH
jgi:hypothetical protein